MNTIKRFICLGLMPIAILSISAMSKGATVEGSKAHPAAIPQPDPRYTPGVVDHTLTKATLCSRSFHTRTKRRVTRSQKAVVCAQYGITHGCPGPGYELDDLISIELGGLNVPRNQWPQPKDGPGVIGFHTKDALENKLHAAVCRGDLTLDEAQQGIATDWYGFGLKNGFIK